MAVRVEGGRPSVTEWKVEERLARHTVVRCFPHTGRTHQIRVHLLSEDHPIVGDPVYGWKSSPGDDLATRLLLHAHRIAFAHPTTGAALTLRGAAPAGLPRRARGAARAAARAPPSRTVTYLPGAALRV